MPRVFLIFFVVAAVGGVAALWINRASASRRQLGVRNLAATRCSYATKEMISSFVLAMLALCDSLRVVTVHGAGSGPFFG